MMNKAELRRRWKSIHSVKDITAPYVAAHCIIRAMLARHDDKELIASELLYRAFAPITNPTKLFNGRWAFDSLKAAIVALLEKGPLLLTPEDGNEARDAFLKLAWKLSVRKWEDKHYVLMVMRSDLSPPQWAVQAAHAALELARVFPNRLRTITPYIRIYGADNKTSLYAALEAVNDHVAWDDVITWCDTAGGEIDGSVTAFVVSPRRDSELRRRILPALKDYGLLKQK